ncbi:putative gypsy/Ty3 element polyprotein [Trifolium medium]|uniref:Putative gypsy/Ty3 element polyprotein n=1 Tax=Trifolium medium TaxID=97028 RepID=A0A392N2N6_9FABA|nr:putative gypsy/Ty3 element polyprotein [Trifolium medium]
MGFEFDIQYKEGVFNTSVDALSRKEGAELLVSLIDSNIPSLMDQIKACWDSDANLTKIISELNVDPSTHTKFSWAKGELRRKGKIVVGNNAELKQQIMHWMHNSAAGGHSGRDSTSARIKSLFFWKGLVKDV